MSKDLSKEYKEAVINDLPDLWGRIEAAIDASEKAEGTVSEEKTVLKNVEKNVNDDSKENIRVLPKDNNEAPVKTVTKTGKKKGFPAWLMVALPSVAILVLVLVPLSLFGLKNSLKMKSASSDAMATANSENYYLDSATAIESDMGCYDGGDAYEAEETLAGSSYSMDFENAFGNDVGLAEDSSLLDPQYLEYLTIVQSRGNNKTELAIPDEDNDDEGLDTILMINPRVRVKIESIELSEGKSEANITIIENMGEYLNGFAEFKVGESYDVIFDTDLNEFSLGEEYEVYIFCRKNDSDSKPEIFGR